MPLYDKIFKGYRVVSTLEEEQQSDIYALGLHRSRERGHSSTMALSYPAFVDAQFEYMKRLLYYGLFRNGFPPIFSKKIFIFSKKMAFIRLPVEVLVDEILPNLDVNTFLSLCETQKDLQVLCEDQRIWKKMVLRDFGDQEISVPEGQWKDEYIFLYEVQKYDIEYWLERMKQNPDLQVQFSLEEMPSLDIFSHLPELEGNEAYFAEEKEDFQGGASLEYYGTGTTGSFFTLELEITEEEWVLSERSARKLLLYLDKDPESRPIIVT